MSAAEYWSEEACDLKNAMRPRYSKDELETLVNRLRPFATKPPYIVFDRPVHVHRTELEESIEFLCQLNFVGVGMLASATAYPDLHREIEALLPAAQKRLRVTRAALAALTGETATEDESPEILEEVKRMFETRAQETARRWTAGEREALAGRKAVDPAELESWLEG